MSSDPARLGLIVPGDCHVDDEFWSLVSPEAIPFVTRTRGASDAEMGRDAITETTGLAEGPEISMAAERLGDVAPLAACYVDTSISFVRGLGGDREIADRVESKLGCPAIVTSTAVAAALLAMGIRRIAVLSPYTDELNERLTAYYAAHAIDTAMVGTMRSAYPSGATSRDLGRLTPQELIEDAERCRSSDIDGVFIPCTAVRTLGAIEAIEASLGVPVVTAIQATMWAVQRLAGISADRPGAGALFGIQSLPQAFHGGETGGI